MLSVVVWQHIILFGSVCAWGASQVCVFLLVHSTSKNTPFFCIFLIWLKFGKGYFHKVCLTTTNYLNFGQEYSPNYHTWRRKLFPSPNFHVSHQISLEFVTDRVHSNILNISELREDWFSEHKVYLKVRCCTNILCIPPSLRWKPTQFKKFCFAASLRAAFEASIMSSCPCGFASRYIYCAASLYTLDVPFTK